jgi:flavin reductase (DIM6/NTAB) family NADH-FMN oxidoreductase RutF
MWHSTPNKPLPFIRATLYSIEPEHPLNSSGGYLMTMVDPTTFKAAAGSFGSGVTVVTSKLNGQVYGITVSAFASLSIDPMQIIVSLRTGSVLPDMIMESKAFAVSILREEQKEVASYFASSGREPCADEFPGVPCDTAVSGAPIIGGSLAHFDCTLATTHDGGDHVIFVGNVVEAAAEEGEPLLYYKGTYRGVREWAANVS